MHHKSTYSRLMSAEMKDKKSEMRETLSHYVSNSKLEEISTKLLNTSNKLLKAQKPAVEDCEFAKWYADKVTKKLGEENTPEKIALHRSHQERMLSESKCLDAVLQACDAKTESVRDQKISEAKRYALEVLKNHVSGFSTFSKNLGQWSDVNEVIRNLNAEIAKLKESTFGDDILTTIEKINQADKALVDIRERERTRSESAVDNTLINAIDSVRYELNHTLHALENAATFIKPVLLESELNLANLAIRDRDFADVYQTLEQLKTTISSMKNSNTYPEGSKIHQYLGKLSERADQAFVAARKIQREEQATPDARHSHGQQKRI